MIHLQFQLIQIRVAWSIGLNCFARNGSAILIYGCSYPLLFGVRMSSTAVYCSTEWCTWNHLYLDGSSNGSAVIGSELIRNITNIGLYFKING